MVLLSDGSPVLAIVVEVQLSKDPDKRYSWPAYATGLRNRFRCPAEVLVVCNDEAVARWAARPIELGGNNEYRPRVIEPAMVPMITDVERAKADPELAVLSAMAHGAGPEPDKAAVIAVAAATACAALDAERSKLYVDLVHAALGDAARESIRAMDPAKYEYQSEFARRYVAEGEAKGRAEVLLELLQDKFGPLEAETFGRVRMASIEELNAWTKRILSARTLRDVLD